MTDIRRPAPDLYSAAQPTPEDLNTLAREGVRTIINLRAPSESVGYDEQREAARLGLHYLSIPVAGSQDLITENIERFSHELAQARSQGAVLVHCASANRAGAMLALDQGVTKGSTPERALALGREAGLTTLEPAVDALIRSRSTSSSASDSGEGRS